MDYDNLAKQNRDEMLRSWHQMSYDEPRVTTWPLRIRIMNSVASVAVFIGYNLVLIWSGIAGAADDPTVASAAAPQQSILIGGIVAMCSALSVIGIFRIVQAAFR